MDRRPEVSIIIPAKNELAFTRQCLDRIWRNSGDRFAYEVIVVDDASTDATPDWLSDASRWSRPVRYTRHAQSVGFAKACNAGAALAQSPNLLFLNNDTLVQPGWLTEMMRVLQSNSTVGIVGIKQLFPYTRSLYHIGIVFAAGGVPQHLYPHLDASLPQVNQERAYQAVTGACLLIERQLFEDCGRFDEEYLNGYEDVDLCLAAGTRGRTTVCCTSAHIYHYGQISEGRTRDDDRNAKRFAQKWGSRVRVDQDEYLARDRARFGTATPRDSVVTRSLGDDCIYFADDLSDGSALTWVNVELITSLAAQGCAVFAHAEALSPTLPASVRRRLKELAPGRRVVGGAQIKWSHYRPRHLELELNGAVNLEFFVINYLFGRPRSAPWDYWLQCLQQNGYDKLPLSEFCNDVLRQVGIDDAHCHVLHPGYAREVHDVEPRRNDDGRFRFLTVTNSHDLERYNTRALIAAFDAAFAPEDQVTLVIKDYGASSGVATLRDLLAQRRAGPRIEYVSEFTSKRDLIGLYKSCDAFVSAHRGEGFAMKILDALACGLPVILPLFGGPTAYCTPENCLPVNFSLVAMGDCLDSRALHITNEPQWAEVDSNHLRMQLRAAFDDRETAAAIGRRARAEVVERFSWDRSAARLLKIIQAARQARRRTPRPTASVVPKTERSPYWLGVRISVVIPTCNRRPKLERCLAALARQSILPQEFEVVVIDDGSVDGTREWLEAQSFPFALRCLQQTHSGPGTARNLGVAQALGELVLFIGDDIYGDERLLEEHLQAHAEKPEASAAVLGHIDWPPDTTPNAVMDYVCGDAMLQFAYSYIASAPVLDHRFFYTSNISLKRRFLDDAAADGISFDPSFRRAAFEDSEFAYRLLPRGLTIKYAERARAFHDHPMDLASFSRREFGAGEMAVVFYRKHPAEDPQLQVRWLADLVGPADRLSRQPALLEQLEAFDVQTDALLQATAQSLETMLLLRQPLRDGLLSTLSTERVRAGLHNVFRTIFDVQRTRGKVREWYASVDDPMSARAAQALASALRKIDVFTATSGSMAALPHAPLGALGALAGTEGPRGGPSRHRLASRLWRQIRRFVDTPAIRTRMLAADRRIQRALQTPERREWQLRYQHLRGRIQRSLS